MEIKTGKMPPHSVEAEQSILGGLLIDPEAWDQVSDMIVEDDFYRPAHQKLYSCIGHLIKTGQNADIVTVTNYLRSKGEFDMVGADYILKLVSDIISTAGIQDHAKIVKEKSVLRKLISTCNTITARAYEENYESVDTFLDQAEAEIFKIGETKETSGLVEALSIIGDSMEKIESLHANQTEITGIGTGFSRLDKMTAGLQPGELVIIAARPSMGKTAFSLNIAQHVALRLKKTVAYFSVEMSKESVMMRMIALEAKINMGEIRTGQIQDTAWNRLIKAAETLGESKLYIDDTSGISPAEIRARARRLKKAAGLDLIMVDYLQIMDLKEKKIEARERQVAEISRALKSLAKELKVPVVALAQLNRGVEGRTEKKPMLSDLRESGSIEQDADVIMMLYREGYYDKQDDSKADHAEVIIAKQRNGPTGHIDLKWEPRFGKFGDADSAPPSPVPPAPPPVQFIGKPKNYAPGAQT